LTLIIAGGVLGMIAGGIQLGVNILIENNNNRKKKERELLQSQAALPVEGQFLFPIVTDEIVNITICILIHYSG
jgi:hypothetical protein